MKTCPTCGELLGNGVDKCFKCGYLFSTAQGTASRSGKKICPKCKTIYDNPSLSHCEKCHVPLAVYTPPEANAKIKANRVLEQFGLADLDSIDASSVDWINGELRGNGALEWSSLFSGAKSSELVMMSCLRALVEQNWVLLRQLNKMNARLEEISKKIDPDNEQ